MSWKKKEKKKKTPWHLRGFHHQAGKSCCIDLSCVSQSEVCLCVCVCVCVRAWCVLTPLEATTSLLSPVRMSAVQELLLLPLALLALQASLCHGACVEVDSDTEAVVNKGFKLGCISCKMRGEVKATAQVSWSFKASNETNFTLIYNYVNKTSSVIDPRFENRLHWNGSKDTVDIQDGSIYILNVSFDDMGTYRCFFDRTLKYLHPQVPDYEYTTRTNKTFILRVVPQLTRGLASILSEVMMYVSIIGLQVWLVIEMIYCYRKIAAAGEEALRESAAEYLAIASESKDNCASVQVAE